MRKQRGFERWLKVASEGSLVTSSRQSSMCCDEQPELWRINSILVADQDERQQKNMHISGGIASQRNVCLSVGVK